MTTVGGPGDGTTAPRVTASSQGKRSTSAPRVAGPELAIAPVVVRRRQEEETVVTFPYLVWREFVAALVIFVFLMVVSIWVGAPLLAKANTAITPNPAKAPWYFLGLQELLERFPPVMAGVAFPTMVLVGMFITPYLDRNPSRRPQDRKLAISMMTLYVMLAVAFVVIGVFFRGLAFDWEWTKILGHPGVVPKY